MKMRYNKTMNKYVFHGSNNGEIKEFIPRESTQKGKYVYATENFEVAGIFGFQMSSIARTLMYDKSGNLVVCERIKNYMQKHDRSVFIYKLDSKPFEYFNEDNWGKNEVRTSQSVKPEEVVKFDSALSMLKQFAKERKIKLYLYPEKPDYLPKNDYDLIKNAAIIYAMNKANEDIFDELLETYPNFKDAVGFVKNKIDSLPESKKQGYAKSIYNAKKQELRPEIESLINQGEISK